MSDSPWADVDRYATDLLIKPSDTLREVAASSEGAGLPPIAVSAPQGKFLKLLAQSIGARRVLELGTLAGYSAIWLAQAVSSERRPGAAVLRRAQDVPSEPTDEGGPGIVVTLEIDKRYAEMARGNIARAGLSTIVDVRLGPALEALSAMVAAREAPFDLIFMDADRPSYPRFLPLVLSLSHVGTVIIADNVVRKGAVVDPSTTDAGVIGVRQFNDAVAREPRLDATLIQTVGAKGYDGFTLARVVS